MHETELSSYRELRNAQRVFKEAPESLKELIRQVLVEERQVMHLKRRSDIHQRVYEHVKRVIK